MNRTLLILFFTFKTILCTGYTTDRIIEEDACQILETCLTFHHLNKHLSFSDGDTLFVINKSKYTLKCQNANFYLNTGAKINIKTVDNLDSIMKLNAHGKNYFVVTKVSLLSSKKTNVVISFQYQSYLSGFIQIEKRKNVYIVKKFEVGES